jgi:hypothetical protein
MKKLNHTSDRGRSPGQSSVGSDQGHQKSLQCRYAILSFRCVLFSILLRLLSEYLSAYYLNYAALLLIVLGMVFGIISLYRIRSIKKKLKGKIYAIIGIGFFIFYCFMVVSLIGFNAISERAGERKYAGYKRLIKLHESLLEYSRKHKGYLPNANNWCDLLLNNDNNLSKEDFVNPYIGEFECNFAFNKNLSGLKLSEMPKNIVLLFEADGDWNLNGGPELLKERKGFYTYILFPDFTFRIYDFRYKGHYAYDPNLRSWTIKQLRWEP